MQEIVVTCGQCERQLRVPEEMLGRLVKCPACGFTFTATSSPPPADAPRDGSDFGSADFPPAAAPPHDGDHYATDRALARSAVVGPAIGLLIVGLLGLLGSGWVFLTFQVNGPEVREATIQRLKADMARDPNQQVPPQEVEQMVDFILGGARLAHLIGLIFSPIVCLAAVQMMRLRTHWLAVTGSILAMINVGCGCCVLGLPFGIWSLVVLFRPDVKALFTS